ncbi:MAG: AAA family ATPase [Planctomycetota bacterium]
MILNRLDLKAFGRFTETSLDLSTGPRRFHIVYGPNESGKSTSLRAITSLFFGIPHVTEDNYLHSNSQLRVGGLLVDDNRRLECTRRKGKKATLRDADDQPIDESAMESMLGGITRETFLSRFGLSHDELVKGGRAIISGEGDLGQILFSAGAGIGRLREIQEELDQNAAAIFTPRGTKTSIATALKSLDEQRTSLRQAQIPPAEYRDLRERLKTCRDRLDTLDRQIGESVQQLSRLRHFQQALPLVPRWRSTIESLKEYRSTPRLDDAFTERRRQTVSDREIARSRRTELQGRMTEMTSRLDDMPADTAILNHQSEIQAVFQEVSARNKADRDRESLIRTRDNLDRKIADLLVQLSAEVPVHHDDARWSDAMEQAIEKRKVSDSNRNRIRQLASDYEKLVSQRNEASDTVESTQRRLSDVSDELETMGSPSDPIVIANAIDAIGNPQTLLESVAEQRESNELLQKKCERLRLKLVGFDGNFDETAALTLPPISQLKQLSESMDAAAQHVATLNKQKSECGKEREHFSRQLDEQQSELPLPTAKELNESRLARDAIVEQLQAIAKSVTEQNRSEMVDSLSSLQQKIQKTDRLNDTVRTHHQQFHQREQLQLRLDQCTQRWQQFDAECNAAAKHQSKANENWMAAWAQCGIKAGDAEQMRRWIIDHELFCETLQQWRDGEKRMDQMQHKIQLAVSRLSKALATKQPSRARSRQPVGAEAYQGGLFDEQPEDDLISLYDEALAARSDALHRKQLHDGLRRRREELAEELPKAEIRLETAQRKVVQWRDEWQRTTENFAGSERVGTQEVSLMLDQIADLHSKKRERDILARRIQSIHDDESDFRSRVNQLVGNTQAESDLDRTATTLAQDLYQRLQAERRTAQTRETLREQIELSKQRMAEAESQQKACEAVLNELCKEAGCDSPDQLPELERAATQRSHLESELRELENQLSLLAGDAALDAFIERAGKQQAETLERELAQAENELENQRQQQSELQQQVGAVQHEINRIDGGAQASELVQTIQFTAGELSRDCEEYAKAKIASLLLRRAIDHYRQAHQSPILQHANRYFQQLTCDAYRELRPDYDSKGRTTLFGLQSSGEAVPAALMSEGTADSLYLALRLASLEYQIGLSKPIPLVIDDCLIQLDDERAAAALKAFSDLSEKTQVILFTHHQHVLDLAKHRLASDDFHTHELGV